MKKILILISFIVSFVCSFGQGIVPRGGVANTPSDQRLQAAKNLYIPRYADTIAANITSANMTVNNIGIDSCGAIIYTYNIDGFWIRKCFPVKHWEQIQNGGSSSILPTCGLKNGTGLVSYDSLLTFDVTAALYALCCDMITRTTNFQTITLDTNSTDFQRYDWIILDSNGVNVVKGTPALNPSTPPTDNCQIILALVSINAHDSVPAFISPTNPLIIYDENYSTEWSMDSSHGIVLDTADQSTPVHLTHDIKVSSFTVNNNDFFFSTATPISLNDYTLLKLYARRTTAQTGKITIYWYLDDVQQTVPATLTLSTTNAYSPYIYPMTSFKIIGSSPTVNRIRIHIEGVSSILYMDWIQLQAGAIISNEAATGIQSVGMNDLDSLLHPTVVNASTTPVFSFTKYNVPPFTILLNNNNVPDQYHWNKLDLSQNYFTGLLPENLVRNGGDGQYLATISGISTWQDFESDTTFIGNWLVRRPDPLSGNDTLYFGYSKRDTSLLAFDTYTGLNNHTWTITNGIDNNFTLTPTSYDLQVGSPFVAEIYQDPSIFFVYNSYDNGNKGFQFTIDTTAQSAEFYSFDATNVTNTRVQTWLDRVELNNVNATTVLSTFLRLYDDRLTFTSTNVSGTKEVFRANGDGSWQIVPITATAASAITPVEGMMLFVSSTDATFITIGFWGYQNGLWVKM